MKRRDFVIVLIGLLLLFLPFMAEAEIVESGSCGENVHYTIDDAELLTIFGSGKMDTYDQTTNSEGAVQAPWIENGRRFKNVVIESGVTSIGGNAFYHCNNLVSISIPENVTKIGHNAFEGCDRLQNITIPESVNSIEYAAFKGCINLSGAIIPYGVTVIEQDTFNNCANLRSTELPESLLSIGNNAFKACISLTSIDLPESLTMIGDYAFHDCKDLSEIVIPQGVTSIGTGAFSRSLYTAYGDTAIRGYSGSAAEQYAIENNLVFTEITITGSGSCGEHLTWTEHSDGKLFIEGFGDMTDFTAEGEATHPWTNSIQKVIFSDDVTGISAYAFYGCGHLKNISLPEGLTRIGDYAFSGVDLEAIRIPDSLTNMGTDALPSGYLLAQPYSSAAIVLSKADYVFMAPDNSECGVIHLFEGEDVTGLELKAVYPRSDTVNIPEGITSIGSYVFWTYSTGNVKNVIIPEGVRCIRSNAFNNCYQLEKVWISDSLVSLEANAFSGSNPILYCSMNSNTAKLISKTGMAFRIPGTKFNLRYLYSGDNIAGLSIVDVDTDATQVEIPEGITVIYQNAFSDCTSLAEVVIPDSVSEIGQRAFYGCSSLTSLTIPDGVSNIWAKTFMNCSNLVSIMIPESVTYIDNEDVFSGHNENLVITGYAESAADDYASRNEITFNAIGLVGKGSCGTNVIWKTYFGGLLVISGEGPMSDYAYSGDDQAPWGKSITRVIIRDGVTSIGDYAFYGTANLADISIPTSVISIGNYAFSGCGTLHSLIIPDGVQTIGEYAINSSRNLKSVTISASVRNIDRGNFVNCYGLEEIVVSEENEYYQSQDGVLFNGEGTHLIRYPTVKEGVYSVPDGVTEIDGNAFWGCRLLSGISFPTTVTMVGDYAFCACDELTEIVFGPSVLTIGFKAVADCRKLATIVVDEDNLAYSSLDGVLFDKAKTMLITYPRGKNNVSYSVPESVATIADEAFYFSRLQSVTIPEGVTSIGDSCFAGNDTLVSITLPESLNRIGTSAFHLCRQLENIVLPYGLSSIGYGTFMDCSALGSITIPTTVTSIADNAFENSLKVNIHCYDSSAALTYATGKGIAYTVLEGTQCGTTASYITDDQGTIIISGSGAIADFGAAQAPWGTNCNTVQIENGITHIGKFAFAFSTIESIALPASLTGIDDTAFDSCDLTDFIVTVPTCDGYAYHWTVANSYEHQVTTHLDPVTDAAVAPTCTMDGLLEGSHCEYCHETIIAQAVDPMSGHQWRETTYVWADDNLSVTATRVCERDDKHTETETIPCRATVALEPTCTVKGKTTFTPAAFENEAFSAEAKTVEDIPALGHDWNDSEYKWTDDNTAVTAIRICKRNTEHKETETVQTDYSVILAPACETTGIGLFTPRSFSNTAFNTQAKEVEIPATGHSNVTDEAVPPTEAQSGLTEGSHCLACGKILVEQEYIHPLVWRTDENEEGLTILEYYGTDRNISIPVSLGGIPVIGAANGAFTGDSCPDHVYFPNGITFEENTFDQSVTVHCFQYSKAYTKAIRFGHDVTCVDNPELGDFYLITLPDDFRLEKDETQEIAYSVWPLTGQEEFVWSSDHPEWISVEDGIATAILPGTAMITLTVGNDSDSVRITSWCDAETFTLSDSEIYIETEQSSRITVASVEPAGADLEITWQSSNTDVVEIGSTGDFTAWEIGDATVTATSQNGISRECVIHVCYPVNSIVLSSDETTLTVDDEIQTTATVTTRDQQYINKLVAFTSSSPDVLTVDASGLVRAAAPGTATVTATSADGKTDSLDFIVRSVTYEPLSVSLGVPYIDSTYVQYYGTLYFIKFEAVVNGGIGPYEYVYQMKRDGEVVYTGDPTSSNIFKSTTGYTSDVYMIPNGIYTATVTVTDGYGDTAFALSDGYYLSGTGYHLIGTCCPFCKSPNRTTDAAVAATCTETGLTEGTHCTDCGEKIIAQEETPALGHDWDDPDYTWVEDFHSLKATRICLRDGSHTEEVYASIAVTVLQSPTEDQSGEKKHTASFEDDAFETREVTLTIPAKKDMAVLRLPAQLKIIEDEAFSGINSEAVIIADECTSIGSKAFADCKNLEYIWIPKSVTHIEPDAFEGCDPVAKDFEE